MWPDHQTQSEPNPATISGHWSCEAVDSVLTLINTGSLISSRLQGLMDPGQLVHTTWLAFISLSHVSHLWDAICHVIDASCQQHTAHTYPHPPVVFEADQCPCCSYPFKIHCIVSKTTCACSDTNRDWHKAYPRGGVPPREVTGSEAASK